MEIGICSIIIGFMVYYVKIQKSTKTIFGITGVVWNALN